jgi:hypothetical protein
MVAVVTVAVVVVVNNNVLNKISRQAVLLHFANNKNLIQVFVERLLQKLKS